ncbi:MAG: hypothetical protein OXL97_07075 [Chloroflexota bacterium]|nr:hypothetical protein [Chloroflexota bacterium]MDE2885392.1 hypothetical protein [Chloroflexota bacterium]
MDEPVRWVSKDTAARELEVSLSTLDRRIRDGDVEVLREGRRVYVRVEGPEYLSDEELLRRAKARTDELGEAVRRWERIASELEREHNAAKSEAADWRDEYEEMKERYLRERSEHERTERWVGRLARAVAVLAVLLIVGALVGWRLLA